MTTKLSSVGSLSKGSYVVIDDEPCRVVDIQTSRPGKHGHAKVRCVGVGIIDGRKRETVMPGHDNIKVPIVDKRNAQILSINGNSANVMDAETYETFDMEVPTDLKDEISEGTTVLYWVIMDQKIMKQVKNG